MPPMFYRVCIWAESINEDHAQWYTVCHSKRVIVKCPSALSAVSAALLWNESDLHSFPTLLFSAQETQVQSSQIIITQTKKLSNHATWLIIKRKPVCVILAIPLGKFVLLSPLWRSKSKVSCKTAHRLLVRIESFVEGHLSLLGSVCWRLASQSL